MATLVIDDTSVTVRLGLREHLLAFSKDVVIPLSTVLRVTVPEGTWQALRGWRIIGTTLPGMALGTRRHATGVDFTAVTAKRDAVLIETTTGRYDQILVSVPDPQGTARQIAEAAGIALP